MYRVEQRRPVRQAADQMIALNGYSPSPRPTAYVLHLGCHYRIDRRSAFPSAVRHWLSTPTGRCDIVEIGGGVESEAQKHRYKSEAKVKRARHQAV